ncbi:Uncharacterised protein [Mycobacteroides abscessus subsp. abscessus]|nr:Uncharacterised protein [Mycobacteroides abscessus subsp. abscessus]
MTGCRIRCIRSNRDAISSCAASVRTSSESVAASSAAVEVTPALVKSLGSDFRSAPAQKDAPTAVSITTRTFR